MPLRTWFAELIGGGVTAEGVLITSGGQSALSAAVRATVPAGAPLLVESPTYPGALAVASAAGAFVIEDDHGGGASEAPPRPRREARPGEGDALGGLESGAMAPRACATPT